MIFLCIGWGWPDPRRSPKGKETTDMPVSQDVQDFCNALSARAAAATSAAVAKATTDLQAAHDQLVAQIQQDHADEVAALNAALEQALPPQPT